MKRILFTGFALLATAAVATAAPLELKDDTAKISYSLGYQIGGDFKNQEVGIDAQAVVQGIQDALDGANPLLSQQQMNELLVALKEKVVARQRQEIYQSGKAFMAANLKKEGVRELPGGAQYRILQEGAGASPTLEDSVDIRFRTSRTDGTAMASNLSDKTPRTYAVNKMLPGLQQAILKMKPGAKWEVFIPPTGRTELTDTGGVLVYELELVAVHPAPGKGN